MTVNLHPLRVAAHIELLSLVTMLANLATVHLEPLSSLLGPTHGCAYLFVVVAVRRLERATSLTGIVAVVPGVGGLLALHRLSRSRISEPGGDDISS